MSLSDLARVIEAASRSAVRAGVTLDDRILTDAFEEVKYGTARARDPSAVERTSRHEAGHTVMYWIQGYWAPHVTVVSRGDYGGYMAHSSAELEQGLGTRNALLGRIRTCLGGRAAELLFYGPDGGLSFGASKDLRMAGGIAKRMACQFGMESDFGLAVAPELMTHEAALGSPLHSLLHQVTGRILKEQMAETVKLLEANRQHLDNVAAELIQKELLNEDDLKRILPASPGMTP
jgi:ATP-dependent Zn protease